MGSRMISVICAVLALAGIVVLAIGYNSYSSEQARISASYGELSEKLGELEAEKDAAEEAISELDSQIADTAGLHPTVSLVFRDGSEKIYTEIYPLMKEHGIKGTVAVSADSVPGGEGLLTGEQLNELVEAGWSIVPEWSAGDGDNGIASVEEWAHLSGYIPEKAVLVPKDADDSVTEAVKAAGHTTVIKDLGAGGEAVVFSDKIGDLWESCAMGYVGNNRSVVVTTAVEQNGHITFLVGFRDEFELYDAGKFSAMLSYLTSHEGGIEIGDIASVRSARKEAEARLVTAQSAAAEQRESYLAKIGEIDRKISDIYKEYGVYAGK